MPEAGASPLPQPLPVTVVGAGLAGSLLALALARRGVATTLVGPELSQASGSGGGRHGEPRPAPEGPAAVAGAPAPGAPGASEAPESAACEAATALSYAAMAGRPAAEAWIELERLHGPLGLRRSSLLLHGWPAPLGWLPPQWQGAGTALVPLSRVDPLALAAALPGALDAAGVVRRPALVERIVPLGGGPGGWRLELGGGEVRQASQVVLAAGAHCRRLWPDLPPQLRFSWAGVIEVPAAALPAPQEQPGWLRHARGGGVVQPLRWRRPALEASSPGLEQEAWIVDAGLAPWGEALLLGQISLVGPDLDPRRPPDPVLMEQRLRQGLADLDPRLAALTGLYRQVPVPYCSDGRPLAEPLSGAEGLWIFSGFSGAFSAVPALADQLAQRLAAQGARGR